MRMGNCYFKNWTGDFKTYLSEGDSAAEISVVPLRGLLVILCRPGTEFRLLEEWRSTPPTPSVNSAPQQECEVVLCGEHSVLVLPQLCPGG